MERQRRSLFEIDRDDILDWGYSRAAETAAIDGRVRSQIRSPTTGNRWADIAIETVNQILPSRSVLEASNHAFTYVGHEVAREWRALREQQDLEKRLRNLGHEPLSDTETREFEAVIDHAYQAGLSGYRVPDAAKGALDQGGRNYFPGPEGLRRGAEDTAGGEEAETAESPVRDETRQTEPDPHDNAGVPPRTDRGEPSARPDDGSSVRPEPDHERKERSPMPPMSMRGISGRSPGLLGKVVTDRSLLRRSTTPRSLLESASHTGGQSGDGADTTLVHVRGHTRGDVAVSAHVRSPPS